MKLARPQPPLPPPGFTIIEAMISIFIISLIGLAAGFFFTNVLSLNNVYSTTLFGQDEARAALKTLSSEIRTISPSSTGAYNISQATATSITFYSNADSDSLKERIRYFLSGTSLKKGVVKPSGNPLTYNPATETTRTLVHDVANGATPIFSYYDRSYDGTTAPLSTPVDIASVRLVKVTLILDKNPAKPPGPRTLTTQVSLRNLKDNL